MVIEKRIDVEDTTFWFRKEIDVDGKLIRQSQRMYNSRYDIRENETFFRIDEVDCSVLHDRKWLCHVTSNDRMDDIRMNGLTPCVGDIYKGYWMRGRQCDELSSLLEPGIFLMRDEKSFKTYFKKPVRLYIDPLELDMSKLYFDHAFPDGKSLFYTGTIPPEKIFVKKRKEGKMQLTSLA